MVQTSSVKMDSYFSGAEEVCLDLNAKLRLFPYFTDVTCLEYQERSLKTFASTFASAIAFALVAAFAASEQIFWRI